MSVSDQWGHRCNLDGMEFKKQLFLGLSISTALIISLFNKLRARKKEYGTVEISVFTYQTHPGMLKESCVCRF